MCGIAGFITTDGGAPKRALLEVMCDRLAHRGPDGFGYFEDDNAGLGHRRLSIIDLSGGAQPLGNEDGSLQVVFNGEIYNFQELREDLVRKGHHFQTHSDTEVLVHLYEDVGERLPEFLNGMFAFAIWDRRNKELFVARDRFGKKPLYYSFDVKGFRLAFASELKAITALPGFTPRISSRGVTDFLSFGYIPDPETIYSDVFKLQPGHSLKLDARGHHLRKYWEPRFVSGEEPSFDDALEEIAALAKDSVKRRMVSDVPIGGFLSGGVDSSAVVAFMAMQAPDRIKTFSIGFTSKKFDELEYARLVVDRYKTDHYEQVVTPSIDEVLEVLANHFDEPFGDASAIPTLYLSRMTRQHVTVALSGDGADEIFAGYRRYHHGAVEERLRRKFPDWIRKGFFRIAGEYYPKLDFMPQVFRAKTVLTNMALEIGDACFNSLSHFRDDGLNAVLSPDLRQDLGDYTPRANYRARFEAFQHLPPLEQIQAVDMQTYLPGDILVKADRATMAYSLEGRSPWMDYRLGELAMRLPSAYKLSGSVGKHIFKRALAPYVPDPILTRSKMGFSVPLAEWFRTSLKPIFHTFVLRDAMERYLSLGEVRKLWDQHQSGLHNHDQKLWNLLMLACWDARHAGGGASALFEGTGRREASAIIVQ